MAHKSGFVNIIGNPNVGKSTLMNSFVGEKLSIITSKSQTTRHRIMGIVNGEDFQIIYSDTPGIIKPSYKMQDSMVGFVKEALTDADVILYVTDTYETIDKNEEYLEKLSKIDIPVFLIVNKIDLATKEKIAEIETVWKEKLPKARIFYCSALMGTNVSNIFDEIMAVLPEFPPYFPKDQLTDKSERFFVSEIVREKILLNYRKEVPYSVEVVVEEFKEDDVIIRIRAIIYVARETQKGIIIGHKGAALKKTGTDARLDLEKFFEKKVFIELYVKVNKDWRDNERQLKQFGYL